tara:strand:+ start:591 stop:1502 length:912 start_codon:yes stop_codon:yes gene_type:complete
MLKKLRKAVAKALPGDTEKYLGTVLALATGNPLFAGIGALADPEAGFGEVATAAFLASQAPGIKGLTSGAAKKGTFMDTVLGRGKGGAGSIAEFVLGKKAIPGTTAGGAGAGAAIPGQAATAGLFGEGGRFIPKDATVGDIISKLGTAAGITGAALAPTGMFRTPEQEVVDTQFPGTDYEGKAFNLTPGQLLDLQLGGGIQGNFFDFEGNLRTAAEGGMAEETNGLKRMEGIMGLADGGTTEFPRKTGEISGPGTGTSDSIPAMLSDGEFVMTAKAVKGAGNGSRMEGAKKMYEMMDSLERRA